MPERCRGVYSKGRGVESVGVISNSRTSRFERRRRKKNPKTAKTMRARPPITPPTIAPTGTGPFGVEVAKTVFPVDVGSDVVVDDDDVPFWTMR